MSDKAKDIAAEILTGVNETNAKLDAIMREQGKNQAVFYYGPPIPTMGNRPFTFRHLFGGEAEEWVTSGAATTNPRMNSFEAKRWNDMQTDPAKVIERPDDVRVVDRQQIVSPSGELVGWSFFCEGGQ